MHATLKRPTTHHARSPVVTQTCELRRALLPLRRHLTHADFVRSRRDRFVDNGFADREFPQDARKVFFLNVLFLVELFLDFFRFCDVPCEHEDARGEAVDAVDGVKSVKVVFFAEDEDNGVVTISTARMDRDGRRLKLSD